MRLIADNPLRRRSTGQGLGTPERPGAGDAGWAKLEAQVEAAAPERPRGSPPKGVSIPALDVATANKVVEAALPAHRKLEEVAALPAAQQLEILDDPDLGA